MNMLGQHDVTDDNPVITLPRLFQHLDEQVAATHAREQRLPVIATEGKEVQIVSALPALQGPRHVRRLK